MYQDDELIFVEESASATVTPKRPWKIVVADDEEEVHAVTRMVLDGFCFEGRELEVLSAYSGKETIGLLREHGDAALLLLDVVMEHETTGLEVVKYVRDELKNHFVRIIMRTGQPGQAPERQVTMQYDINDYKEKTELTAQKLYTTVVASLRAYRDLRTIERHRKSLEQIISISARLFELRNLKQFVASALFHIAALLDLNEDAVSLHTSGFAVKHTDTDFHWVAGIGEFAAYDFQALPSFPPSIQSALMLALDQRQTLFTNNTYVGYFRTKRHAEYLLCLQSDYNFSELEIGFIRIFATNLAVAFDNLALTEEIEDTQREVIFTLGEVVENRSEDTGNHVKRVGEYSYLLAKKYGFDEETAELLRFASPMHDVGKIGIPDAILNKPGKLTDEEFEIIKTHTLIGYDILKGSKQKILQMAAQIALEHHERWDGRGYPQGKTGEQTSVLARIVKIADVFDALSCRRVYKDAWGIEQIVATLTQDRGTHFDPTLIDLTLANMNQMLEIKQRLQD